MSDALRQAILTHPNLSDQECADLIDETYTLEADAKLLRERRATVAEEERLWREERTAAMRAEVPPVIAQLNIKVHRLGNFGCDIEVPDDVYVHSDEVHHAVRYALDSIRQEWREGPYEVEPP